jgi:hypothetical protein
MRFGISKAVLGIPTPGRAARFDPTPHDGRCVACGHHATYAARPRAPASLQTRLDGQMSFRTQGAALREARLAHLTTVLDEQVREQCPLLSRHQLHQIELDLVRVLVRSQAQELG